ncbi:MAG TPA: flagellar basal body rod protein FlgC [Solirubrobacteraceae bacterium]|jgi:flagellar basal-body rod protein FlgC|nr:flagellar basal body rod protein FlgC [Solirubrobacteraceae bacterium]
MSFFDSIDVAASGLTAERVRMDVTSENLANAQTTNGAGGQPYRRQEVVLQQSGGTTFGSTLAGAIGGSATPGGVQVAGIVNDPTPDQLVYDPGHPGANAQGYVRMPNVNPVTEMTDLIDESNSYQADVTAMNTAKTMFTKTLDLLK